MSLLEPVYNETEKPQNCPEVVLNGLKLKGGAKTKGKEDEKVKVFHSKESKLNTVLNLLRSSAIFQDFGYHKKCPVNSNCNFCLLRSAITKTKLQKGRCSIIPVEVELMVEIGESSISALLEKILHKAMQSFVDFRTAVVPNWHYLCSNKTISNDSGLLLELDETESNHKITNLLKIKYTKMVEAMKKINSHGQSVQLKINIDQQLCIFLSTLGMEVEFNELVSFGGKDWKCVGATSNTGQSFFRSQSKWFISSKDKIIPCHNKSIENIQLAVYDATDYSESFAHETVCYTGPELEKIRNKTSKRKEDRHLKTPKRDEDRHLNPEKDRHLKTPKRKLDVKNNMIKYRRMKKERELLFDTGMDCVCSSCAELKSSNSCVLTDTLPIEKIQKYCTETELTINKDGKFYVCNTCKQSLKADIEPRRCQKEMLGFLTFPKRLMVKLENCCTPFNEKEAEDPEKRYLQLNRLEDYLLKPVIPFIRIAHLPRGRYFQLKGDLIMVSANVVQSMNTVLPVSQNLIPVALKRKMEYSGHYMQEYIDRLKLRTYFEWFKRHNHIFQNMELDESSIDKFEHDTQMLVEESDNKKDKIMMNHDEMFKKNSTVDEIYDSDEEEVKEEATKLDNENVSCDHSSFITNKYAEDLDAPTVANKLSDMIIELEQPLVDEEIFNPDSEESYYVEDEVYLSDDEDDDDMLEDYDEEEIEQCNAMIKIKQDSRQAVYWIKSNVEDLCKCAVQRKIALVISLKFQLDKMNIDNSKLADIRNGLLTDFDLCIDISNNFFKKYPENCHHERKEIQNDIENFIKDNEYHPEKTMQFVRKQTRKIKENVEKLSLAPSEEGKWTNWKSDVFLEEKLFPKLFPYGVGGFLSSNILKKNNMGFSNYIKSRLLSVDPKFRNDASYTFFLLLVKELTDMKRSEQTYFRKATKIPNLTAKNVSDISKEHLFRYNNAFTTFKTIRGTSMYFQDTKKKLMATLRQKGAPTLFATFSCAEFEWEELAKSIYETVTRTEISMDEIKQKPSAWKNKLISENVTQSTLHFAKRTDKIMSLLNKEGIFTHQKKKFSVDSYFYRVEFQARGAPHIHCLLWLEDELGKRPPSMWNENKEDENKLGEQIASFGASMMSGSSTDMNCDDHEIFDYKCEECQAGRELVEKFQSHSHTFSCKKKCRFIRILSADGHGRHDGNIEGEEILVPVCRLRHPKNPIDKAEFIHAFPQDTDDKIVKAAKKDYEKIRKYLLRITYGENFKSSSEWKTFKSLSFNEFLYEVGMLEGLLNDETAITKARARYLTALRCEVKSSGLFLLRRNTEDIFTNNFNKKLIKIHSANQDIQYITDEYAVAEYITNYVTKNESGLSLLLKNINDEAIAEGEDVVKTIKKLGKALDKGREMSIQEATYRALGLSMTKFSDLVRFISTKHPDRRDGLLKSNIDDLEEDERIFHNSLHDYYQIRPENSESEEKDWEGMCLADFVGWHNIASSSQSRNKTSPNLIKLLDDKSYVTKRRRKCVLRYFLRYDSEEEYYRALCILFLPFRNEKEDIHQKDVKHLYDENKDKIEKNRSEYEKHKTIIDRIEEVEIEKKEDHDEFEEEDVPFVDDETTSKDDIEDFEKNLKKEAQKMLRNYNAGIEIMEEGSYLEMIRKLNKQQRKIFNDYCERINSEQEGNNFYLYIGGEAGTGKSFLLRAMINATKKRGERSGAELDKPVCLTLAPTGVAAYLVNGTTIESGLGLQPTRERAYLRNPSSKNSSLRFLYEDLLCIFVDEISMVGSDMLAKMNYRMQEIMGNNSFMGGVSLVCTGDFGQLPPVGQRLIWETSYLDSRIDISPNHWNDYFKIYYLTEKMRSQDEEFSIICDQVRKGICDDTVDEYFQRHVGTCPSQDDNEKYAGGGLSIIVTTNSAREKINMDKLEKLLPGKKVFYANAIDKSTNNPNAPEVSEKLPLTKTGQLQKKIIFKEGAPVMITSNHPKSKYKNNGFVNGARGYIDSIQPAKEDPEIADIIWVCFNDEHSCKLLRLDSRALLKNHTPNNPLAVPITRQKKQFKGRGNTEYMRDQFPLTLCYAVTAHKSQGQTLAEVVVDFSGESRINNGSFYTSISRVKYGSNLYLKDFKKSYIKANPDVEMKMESMKLFKPYNFKKVYNNDNIFTDDTNEIKLGYVNINSILTGHSSNFLNEDENLLALNFLAVADTRLSTEVEDNVLNEHLSNWSVKARYDSKDSMDHMGLVLLKSKRSTIREEPSKIEEMSFSKNGCTQIQMLLVTFPGLTLNCAFVYMRKTPTKDELNFMVENLSLIDLVMGDLNLDTNRKDDDRSLQSLCSERSRVLNEVTTSRFNQLDHVLLNCNRFKLYFSTSFMNFTSDHHTIIIRVSSENCSFTDDFLEKMSFNADRETKNAKRRGTPIADREPKKARKEVFKNEKKENKRDSKKEFVSEDFMEEEQTPTKQIDLTCLYAPNWLNDEIIDCYFELLNKVDDNIFMFTTYFHQSFTQGGYEKVKNYYRNQNLLSFKTIYIPVHYANHWFLITISENEIVSYDPYNYPEAKGAKRVELLNRNMQFHTEILRNLRENYLKPLYRKYGKFYKDIAINVKVPPTIPAQDNNSDCGVFLLTFTKYLVFNREFNFCTQDMVLIRNVIRSELEHDAITSIGPIPTNSSNEKELNRNKLKLKKKKKVQEDIYMKQRRIINPDAETCWLNSCLQLVLVAFDHTENLSEIGSTLWDNLIWMKGKDSSVPLDPTDVKLAIVQIERERMIRDNIAPNHMLFDLGNLQNVKDVSNQVSIRRIGQQDCKDFFFCLDENRHAWPDVHNFFKVNTISKTECVTCKNVSCQEIGTERSFISLSCPNENVSMKQHIEDKMNTGEMVNGWRDEEGCRKLSKARCSQRISNIAETEFVIFVLERLVRIEGSLHIMNTKVTVEEREEITLLDINGESAKFFPIAIIHHTGNVTGDSTHGHYQADVRNKETNSWFRTSDNDCPISLSGENLTRKGYIFLYKKSSGQEKSLRDPGKTFIAATPSPKNTPSLKKEKLLNQLLALLDEMNLDLVFTGIFKLISKFIYHIKCFRL